MNILAFVPPDLGELFTPAAEGVQGVVADVLPVAIPVMVLLAGIGIAIRVFGKFGVRK